MKTTPYEYYNGKLGVKISFITSDRNHPESLKLFPYRTFKKRMDSSTCIEKQLREGSWSCDALVLFSSLSQDLKDAITIKFGKPNEEIKKSWFSEHYTSDKKAFDFYSAYRYRHYRITWQSGS